AQSVEALRMVGTDVRDVLDRGSWAMTENLRVRCHSQRLADEARDLLLTYRSHHLCEISGGTSEDADGIVKLRYLLRSAPGDALCDGCLSVCGQLDGDAVVDDRATSR